MLQLTIIFTSELFGHYVAKFSNILIAGSRMQPDKISW